MRELAFEQIECVSGGDWEAIGLGSAIGGGVGLSAYGGTSMAGWAAAGAVGAMAGAALVGSFLAGYAAGTWIYENVIV